MARLRFTRVNALCQYFYAFAHVIQRTRTRRIQSRVAAFSLADAFGPDTCRHTDPSKHRQFTTQSSPDIHSLQLPSKAHRRAHLPLGRAPSRPLYEPHPEHKHVGSHRLQERDNAAQLRVVQMLQLVPLR